MDEGRYHDLKFIDQKLAGYDLRQVDRKKLEDAKGSIQLQLKNSQLAKVRAAYTAAVKAGDKAEVDKLMGQLQRLEHAGKL